MPIRELRPADVEFLYRYQTETSESASWRRSVPSNLQDFEAEMLAVGTEHFVVSRSIVDEQPSGLISLYNRSPGDRTVFMAVLSMTGTSNRLRSLLSCVEVLEWLFVHRGERIVYLEVPGYNVENLSSAIGWTLEEEVRYESRLYSGGSRHDLHLYAIHRERWSERRSAGFSHQRPMQWEVEARG